MKTTRACNDLKKARRLECRGRNQNNVKEDLKHSAGKKNKVFERNTER